MRRLSHRRRRAAGSDPPAVPSSRLQVAEKTTDVARHTLVEMHRQGAQLERAELGMQQVGIMSGSHFGGWTNASFCDSSRHKGAYWPA